MKARKLLTNWHFKTETCECCGQETEKEWTTVSYFVRARVEDGFLKVPWAKYNPIGWLCLIKSHYDKDDNATLLFRNNPMLSNVIKWGGGNEPT